MEFTLHPALTFFYQAKNRLHFSGKYGIVPKYEHGCSAGRQAAYEHIGRKEKNS